MKLDAITKPNFKAALTELTKLELPVAAAYKLIDVSDRVNKELQKFAKLRGTLLDKYAKKDDQGKFLLDKNAHVFDGDNLEKFVSQIQALLDTEVPLPKLTVEELKSRCESCKKGSDLTISAQTLLNLGDLIERPAKVKTKK